MKFFATLCFFLSLFNTQAQDSTYRLNAIGIDVFKNLPFLIGQRYLPPFRIMGRESYSFSNPKIIELYGQWKAPQKRALVNVGLGYAAIDLLLQQRLRQNISGYYLKVGREFHSQLPYKTIREFWGYNLTLTRAKVKGQIEINGQYFPNYTAPIPDEVGIGIGCDYLYGFSYLFFGRMEARLAFRGALLFSDIGSPNAIYLPGGGIRTFYRKIVPSGGVSLQLFYFIKKA